MTKENITTIAQHIDEIGLRAAVALGAPVPQLALAQALEQLLRTKLPEIEALRAAGKITVEEEQAVFASAQELLRSELVPEPPVVPDPLVPAIAISGIDGPGVEGVEVPEPAPAPIPDPLVPGLAEPASPPT